MAARTTTALSFENSPMVTASARPESHASLRQREAAPPWTWHSRPASTPKPASRSARPTMLVTDSVITGCTAQTAVYLAEDGVPVCAKCGARLKLELTEVAPG